MKPMYRINLLLLNLLLGACSHQLSGGPVTGKVLEAGTLRPIPGAIVAVLWKGHISISIADGRTICYHVATATTDQAGNYYVPAWTEPAEGWRADVSEEYNSIVAYHPQYANQLQSSKNEETYLTPFEGTAAKRIEFLTDTEYSLRCNSGDQSEKNLIPLTKIIYGEVRSLAATKDQRTITESLLFRLEILELGYELAEKRYMSRLANQKL